MSATPHLSDRSRGWLRFVWDKATTPDDWSSAGTPNPWWDRDSTAPMCAFPRFDLGETAYILPVLADQTPAWREVYTRIADELVGRHTTFWAAIDWLTLIGHDPDQANYPPEWLGFLPERLRGRYDAPGWTGNGIEPWGLQPDPIGSDGNLFFRGFFNLLLSVYRSVSGDEKWERPFDVAGYQDRRFEWTHHDIAEFLYLQWKDRPQGPHCENTKIWPFCLSAAGLGLQLYDGVAGTAFHGVYDEWVEYAKQHYLVRDSKGGLQNFPFYYDPIEDVICGFPDPLVAMAALSITPYLVPQHPEFGRYLYEEAVRKLGWNDPSKPIVELFPDPRFISVALLVAQDLGDETTAKRLARHAEEKFDPRWFGEENDRFGWWFGLDEPWPRGQLSALQMVCDAAGPGAWSRAFREPNLQKFDEPTVEGVDYPSLAIRRAWNDPDEGVLLVGTCVGTPSRRGVATTFRVAQLPEASCTQVCCDGEAFPRWRVIDERTIEIETDVDAHEFRIATRVEAARDPRDAGARGTARSEEAADPVTANRRDYAPAAAASCSCCAVGAP
ncbi:MAG: hypothetical protein QNK03_16345 [Myxococcota bacterium]|nr:hypothetical protein [Myxococcota bacterium]